MNKVDAVANDRSDGRVVKDASIKQVRLRVWLEKRGLDGVIITRRDNFAWLTGGGDSRVVERTEEGFGTILITPTEQYIIAHRMDAARLFEEQAPGQGYELVTMSWHEGDPRDRALELAGKKVAADTLMAGAQYVESELVDLHYPLTPLEVARYRWMGEKLNEIYMDVGSSIKPGMTERQVADALRIAHIQNGMDVEVLIVGADDRVFRYRHPLPTQKPIEKYVLLHAVAQRWGLHANPTRSVHIGKPTPEVRKVFDAASTVAARLYSRLKPGVRFADILTWQKAWYAEVGYPDEWHNHFQGGPTGYVIADVTRCLTDKVVQAPQPFEWFITLTGTKVAEVALLTEEKLELVSMGPGWPTMAIEAEHGPVILPDLLLI